MPDWEVVQLCNPLTLGLIRPPLKKDSSRLFFFLIHHRRTCRRRRRRGEVRRKQLLGIPLPLWRVLTVVV